MTFVFFQLITYFAGLSRSPRGVVYVLLSLFLLYFGFSYANGNDWIGYFKNYDCLINGNCTARHLGFEWGYNLVVNLFGGFAGFQSLTLGIAVFASFALLYFSLHFRYPAFPFMILVGLNAWHLYIELSRQSLAQSFILFSIFFLIRRKLVLFVVLVLAASLFHSSAVIVLLLLPFSYYPVLYRVSVLSLVVGVGLFMLLPLNVISLFSEFAGMFSPMLNEKLEYYAFSQGYAPQFVFGLGAVGDILLIGVTLYLINLAGDQGVSPVIKMGAFLYCVILVAAKMHPVLVRLSFYFLPFLALLWAAVFGGLTGRYSSTLPLIKVPIFFKYIFIVAILVQGLIRPFAYDYMRDAIFNYQNAAPLIFLDHLDDQVFRDRVEERCDRLRSFGYTDMC